jgi:hypothetical protein
MELFFAAVGVALSATSTAKENYAVLVGVNNYTNLDRQYQLQGAANDVALMQSVLRSRGFADDHILIVADGISGAQAPTRQGIMGALAAITQKAQHGDFVYLHFSGHGSQQPEDAARTDRGHKPDGMNEIFLPRDVGTWSERDTSVSNAIVDFEINAVITALRNKGVFVWAVFDSCHSASMARGAALEDVRFRQVDPARLGVPANRIEKAMRDSAVVHSQSADAADDSPLGSPRHLNRDAAGFVAFYAAQTSETAPEMTLPRNVGDGKHQGLFSFTLAQALEQNGSLSYRQLRDFVLYQYAAQGQLSTTPLIEGTDLDAPIFGDANVKRVQQWAISLDQGQASIRAGAMQDISDGALFAIISDPLQPDAQAIGYLQAAAVKVFESSLVDTPQRPSGKQAIPALSPDAIPKGSYARLLQSAPNFLLTVAMPPSATSASGDEVRVRKIIQQLKAAPPSGLRVTWVAPDQPADLRLSFGPLGAPKSQREPGQLWLLPPSGELIASGPARSHSIALAQPDADVSAKLQDSLQRISHYVNLLRVSAQLGTSGVADTEVQAILTRANAKESAPLPDGALPKLYSGDIVEFKILNNGQTAADVTLLFLDSQYGITAMYPLAGRLNRIKPGGEDHTKIRIEANTVGVERMLVIAVAAEPNQPNADFSFLQQQTLPTERGQVTRGSPLSALFADAAFGPSATRGAEPVGDIEAPSMRLISWQTAIAPDSSKTPRQ